MKMILKDAHAKPQSRKEIQMSKAQLFFAPLRLCVSICLLSFAVGARAETTNDLSDAEIQGRNLARQLLEQWPVTNFVQNGILSIRDAKGTTTNVPVKIETTITATNWVNIYEYQSLWTNIYEHRTSEVMTKFIIKHNCTNLNQYETSASDDRSQSSIKFTSLDDYSAIKIPFASSDFWICDLGLEFFHWPEQKILRKELKRTRGCSVLESTNPNPSANGYSRVVSWIDEKSGGIVQAFAYDAQGKKLKEFYPKNLEKVNGQYQVQEMEMDNVQTGSRSRIEFDLNKQ